MKSLLEKDIESTIRLLRFLTHSEGTVHLGIFDSGSFEESYITAYLERSGMTIQSKTQNTPIELKSFLLGMANPFNSTEEEIIARYKKSKWNDE